jgi:hypothetical protein
MEPPPSHGYAEEQPQPRTVVVCRSAVQLKLPCDVGDEFGGFRVALA